jgi:hypothetical protein
VLKLTNLWQHHITEWSYHVVLRSGLLSIILIFTGAVRTDLGYMFLVIPAKQTNMMSEDNNNNIILTISGLQKHQVPSVFVR